MTDFRRNPRRTQNQQTQVPYNLRWTEHDPMRRQGSSLGVSFIKPVIAESPTNMSKPGRSNRARQKIFAPFSLDRTSTRGKQAVAFGRSLEQQQRVGGTAADITKRTLGGGQTTPATSNTQRPVRGAMLAATASPGPGGDQRKDTLCLDRLRQGCASLNHGSSI